MLTPQILEALATITTREDIAAAHDYLMHTSRRLNALSVCSFYPGQRVQFTDQYFTVRTGTIIKLNKTTISVSVDDPKKGRQTWKVSASLLKASSTTTETNPNVV